MATEAAALTGRATKDLKACKRPINARSETIASSGMFRGALESGTPPQHNNGESMIFSRAKTSTWLDLFGIVLPLIGSIYLSFEAIPLALGPILTDTKGVMLTNSKGQLITATPDPITQANHARYIHSAIVANLIIAAGTAIQARRPVAHILARPLP